MLATSNLKCNTPFRIKASRSKRTYEQINEAFDLMHEGKSIRSVVKYAA